MEIAALIRFLVLMLGWIAAPDGAPPADVSPAFEPELAPVV